MAIPPLPDPDPFRDPFAVALVDLIFERGYEAVDERMVVERAGTDSNGAWSRSRGRPLS